MVGRSAQSGHEADQSLALHFGGVAAARVPGRVPDVADPAAVLELALEVRPGIKLEHRWVSRQIGLAARIALPWNGHRHARRHARDESIGHRQVEALRALAG